MRGPTIMSTEAVVVTTEPNGDGRKAAPRRRRPKSLTHESRMGDVFVPESMIARRKIAILGYTEHRKYAPWNNPEWEVWGLNDLYHEIPDGVTIDRLRWFQVHAWEEQGLRPDSPTDFKAGPPHPRDPNHVAWLKEWSSRGMRLYMLEQRKEVPDALVMDKEAMFRYFDDGNGNPIRYFTNSISWMLGVAIMELAPDKKAVEGAEIGVFGVDMMMAGGPGSEYGYQRPSCEFFLGWARGLGITIHIPKESDLLKSLYQYGETQNEYFRVRLWNLRNEMSKRRGEATNVLQQSQHAHAELTGYINCLDHLIHSHMPCDPEEGKGRAPVPDGHKTPEGAADG